jgi:hypothetical protein
LNLIPVCRLDFNDSNEVADQVNEDVEAAAPMTGSGPTSTDDADAVFGDSGRPLDGA